MEAQRYWAIKTKEGIGGHDYWRRFADEGVIAIGWHRITVRPDVVSRERLESSIKEKYPDDNEKHGAHTIKKFIDIAVGDRVLICRGYPPNQLKDVYIYGFATVTGPFHYDEASNWCWRSKHRADICCLVERYVPIDLVRKTLNKESMRQTLHEIQNEEGFQRLESQLCNYVIKE